MLCLGQEGGTNPPLKGRRPQIRHDKGCTTTVLAQKWYGVDYNTCSVKQIVTSCDANIATSTCPSARVASSTTSPSSFSSTANTGTTDPEHHHGLSQLGQWMLIVFVGIVPLCFLLALAFPYIMKQLTTYKSDSSSSSSSSLSLNDPPHGPFRNLRVRGKSRDNLTKEIRFRGWVPGWFRTLFPFLTPSLSSSSSSSSLSLTPSRTPIRGPRMNPRNLATVDRSGNIPIQPDSDSSLAVQADGSDINSQLERPIQLRREHHDPPAPPLVHPPPSPGPRGSHDSDSAPRVQQHQPGSGNDDDEDHNHTGPALMTGGLPAPPPKSESRREEHLRRRRQERRNRRRGKEPNRRIGEDAELPRQADRDREPRRERGGARGRRRSPGGGRERSRLRPALVQRERGDAAHGSRRRRNSRDDEDGRRGGRRVRFAAKVEVFGDEGGDGGTG